MTLRNNTQLATALAIFLAVVLLPLSVISFILLLEYLEYGELSDPFIFEGFICFVILPVLLIVFTVVNASNALSVSSATESRRVLRACYFAVLYPVFLLLFLFSSIGNGFSAAMTFGFPVFIIGGVGLPWAAFVVMREAVAIEAGNLLRVVCHKCSYVFEIHKSQPEALCPFCGAHNINPLTVPAGEGDVEVLDDGEGGEDR